MIYKINLRKRTIKLANNDRLSIVSNIKLVRHGYIEKFELIGLSNIVYINTNTDEVLHHDLYSYQKWKETVKVLLNKTKVNNYINKL